MVMKALDRGNGIKHLVIFFFCDIYFKSLTSVHLSDVTLSTSIVERIYVIIA